jgi:hypothetical protein
MTRIIRKTNTLDKHKISVGSETQTDILAKKTDEGKPIIYSSAQKILNAIFLENADVINTAIIDYNKDLSKLNDNYKNILPDSAQDRLEK